MKWCRLSIIIIIIHLPYTIRSSDNKINEHKLKYQHQQQQHQLTLLISMNSLQVNWKTQMTIILKNDINIYFRYYFYYVMPRKKKSFLSGTYERIIFIYCEKSNVDCAFWKMLGFISRLLDITFSSVCCIQVSRIMRTNKKTNRIDKKLCTNMFRFFKNEKMITKI